MSCWAWMSGKDNIADWLTRGRSPQDLDEESEWWNGPAILYQPVEEWGLKFGSQKEECLSGERRYIVQLVLPCSIMEDSAILTKLYGSWRGILAFCRRNHFEVEGQ